MENFSSNINTWKFRGNRSNSVWMLFLRVKSDISVSMIKVLDAAWFPYSASEIEDKQGSLWGHIRRGYFLWVSSFLIILANMILKQNEKNARYSTPLLSWVTEPDTKSLWISEHQALSGYEYQQGLACWCGPVVVLEGNYSYPIYFGT